MSFKKKVQGFNPLNDGTFYGIPFFKSDDSWDDVEGKNSFYTFFVIVNGKCHPLVHEELTRKLLHLIEFFNRCFGQVTSKLIINRSQAVFFLEHFIPGIRRFSVVGVDRFQSIAIIFSKILTH